MARVLTFRVSLSACACALALTFLAGCKAGGGSGSGSVQTGSTQQPVTVGQEQGVEKQKPAPGTGNVQGTVLYNGKPVGNIKVKLCEKFNRFFGGCDGKIYTARTEADGVYVITNVPPNTYEALTAQVFDTDMYVFATSGVAGLSSEKYEVKADKTLFIPPTNLFKDDLKIVSPKAGAKVSAKGLELKWQPYPDAAYYKFTLYAQEPGTVSPYINQRTEETSAALDKPMPKGEYRIEVEAYNAQDKKLAECADDIKFTITDGAAQ